MRLTLMSAALAVTSACGGAQDKGPERSNAAGEVLGGEVSDDMLPLDSARSTSPADPTGKASGDGRSGDDGAGTGPEGATPSPTLTAAPMPDMTMPADPEPLRTDNQ